MVYDNNYLIVTIILNMNSNGDRNKSLSIKAY